MTGLTAHISPCAVEINSRVCANYGPGNLSPNLRPLGLSFAGAHGLGRFPVCCAPDSGG